MLAVIECLKEIEVPKERDNSLHLSLYSRFLACSRTSLPELKKIPNLQTLQLPTSYPRTLNLLPGRLITKTP